MREILFRGKRIDNGEWQQGHNIILTEQGKGRAFIVPMGEYIEDCQTKTGELILRMPQIEIVSETVGQYTGLTDKNGTKIFEGDICQHRSYYSDNIVISVVTYTDGQFLALVDENSGFNLSDKLEVIGNIHDNSELLKGGEEE